MLATTTYYWCKTARVATYNHTILTRRVDHRHHYVRRRFGGSGLPRVIVALGYMALRRTAAYYIHSGNGRSDYTLSVYDATRHACMHARTLFTACRIPSAPCAALVSPTHPQPTCAVTSAACLSGQVLARQVNASAHPPLTDPLAPTGWRCSAPDAMRCVTHEVKRPSSCGRAA